MGASAPEQFEGRCVPSGSIDQSLRLCLVLQDQLEERHNMCEQGGYEPTPKAVGCNTTPALPGQDEGDNLPVANDGQVPLTRADSE